MTEHNFPRGPESTERRYIKAFEGLTQMIAEKHASESWVFLTGETFGEVWEEMFNTLAGTEEKNGTPGDL